MIGNIKSKNEGILLWQGFHSTPIMYNFTNKKQMKEILEKISSYNIFNFLFPGIVFVLLTREITDYDFIPESELLGLFLYYFVGLVISRVGSLIIEPLMKVIAFVKFTEYDDYISASKKDDNIKLLSEVNNMYRTIISMFFLVLLLKAYEWFESSLGFTKEGSLLFLIVFLLILFGFSYRKQTKFIAKRVYAQK